ncbi:MAG: hypothetical protein SGILL_005455 [Bacillariaceae sp.]
MSRRKRKNLSTTPLLQLALENCVVKVGYDFDDNSEVKEMVQQQYKTPPLLLYPSKDAMVLDDEMFIGGDDGESNTDTTTANATDHLSHQHLLILIDGTWGEAKRMVRESPKMVASCRKVKFDDDNPDAATSTSIYDQIRKEPKSYCLSTLEACSKALGHLEEDASKFQQTLHSLLQAHVDAHLRNMEERTAAADTMICAENDRSSKTTRFVNRGHGHPCKQQRRQEIMERMQSSGRASRAAN